MAGLQAISIRLLDAVVVTAPGVVGALVSTAEELDELLLDELLEDELLLELLTLDELELLEELDDALLVG
jgi:hypothetical protein